MPLTLAEIGQTGTIRRVGGRREIKQHLLDLGFVPGGDVTVLAVVGGNVIIKVQESRMAIGKDLAQKIWI